MNILNLTISAIFNGLRDWASSTSERPGPGTALTSAIAVVGLTALTAGSAIYAYCIRQRSLDLSHRDLIDPPDVTQRPRLRRLNLNHNDLRLSSNVTRNPALEELLLHNNGLVVSPNVTQCPRLRTLDLGFNRLAHSSDVTHNSELEILILAVNRLTVCPDVTRCPRLRTLDLSHNLTLRQPPNVTQCPRLRVLDLSVNWLTQSPDVTNNPALEEIFLQNNQLTVCPEVTGTPRLRTLNLSSNQLTALSDSILSLPLNCEVDVEGNRFAPGYAQMFMQRLEQHRREHPGQGPRVHFGRQATLAEDVANLVAIHFGIPPGQPQGHFAGVNPAAAQTTLEQELDAWSREFAEGQNRQEGTIQDRFASLLALDPDNRTLLSTYLRRLREVEDYQNDGPFKTNVIQRVDRMLELANRNEEFRLKLLALLNEGLTDCRDKVLVFFNDIEILWQFYHKELSREEFRDLAIRAQRYERLKKHAQEEAETRGLGDEIETILYFHLKLKEALNLPITTENMSYADASGVTPEMLAEAREKIEAISDEELLRDSSYWQEYMQKSHRGESERITNRYGQLLEDAAAYCGLEPKERPQFLEGHPEFKNLLDQNETQGPPNYNAIALLIDQERTAAIAGLDNQKRPSEAKESKG